MSVESPPSSSTPIGNREKFMIACGTAIKDGAFGNQSSTSQGQAFETASKLGSAANGLGGVKNLLGNLGSLQSLVGSIPKGLIGNSREISIPNNFEKLLNQKISQMTSYSEVSETAAKNFLFSLASIDNLDDMTKFADAIQIPELVNSSVLNNFGEILDIKDLYKGGYLAQSIDGLTGGFGQFSNYLNGLQDSFGSTSSVFEAIESVLGNLGGVPSLTSISDMLPTGTIPNLGGIDLSTIGLGEGGGISLPGGGTGMPGGSGNPTAAAAATIMGNLLTKLVQGKEIPMGIQANNPMLQSPSLIGKMMFGEAGSASSAVDMNQLFAKPIGIFSEMKGGAGSQMFNFKNVGSMKAPQSLDSIITKVAFGGNTPKAGSFGEDILKQLQQNVGDKLGAGGSSQVNMGFPDNAIPISGAMSDALSGISEKLPQINKDFRSQIEKITSNNSNITEIMQNGLNADSISKLGLSPESLNVPGLSSISSIGNFKNIFPTSVFSGGFTDAMSATSALKNSGITNVMGLI